MRAREPVLRTGGIEFLQAGEQRLGFCRIWEGRRLRVYANRSGEAWEVPAGQVVLGHNLHVLAPNWLRLEPMGFCVTQEE